jgi:hypothetical protein
VTAPTLLRSSASTVTFLDVSSNERREIRNAGAASLREIAAALNDRNIPTPRKGAWSATQVARVLERVKVA